MHADRTYWPAWVRFLHRWGKASSSRGLLNYHRSFKIGFCAIVYRANALSITERWKMAVLASLLEDEAESRSFAAFIREREAR
jgi:hypothetical protein